MSHPSAPPPYEDRNPLYPDALPPGVYGQPSVLPGGYPAYPQPGYGHPAGYPQPMPPIHPTPMNYGESLKGSGGGWEEAILIALKLLPFLPSQLPLSLFSIFSLALSFCFPIFVTSLLFPSAPSPADHLPAPLFRKETGSVRHTPELTHQMRKWLVK